MTTNDQTSSTPESLSVTDHFIDIVPKELRWKARDKETDILLGIIILIVVIFLVISASVGSLGAWDDYIFIWMPVILCAVVIICAYVFITRDQSGRLVLQLFTNISDSNMRDRLQQAWENTPKLGAHLLLRMTIHALTTFGKSGVAVRVQKEEPKELMRPIDVPFEPVPLNESEMSLRNLDKATAKSSELTIIPAAAVKDDSIGYYRRFRRNVCLRGGWWSVIGGVLSATIMLCSALYFLCRGDYMGALILFLLAGASLFLRSSGGSALWLVVPGGIVIRRLRGISRAVTIELYDRTSSIACVLEGPISWTIAVSKGKISRMTVCTRKEAEFFLRAWFSPIEPPSMERLSDLKG